jgi:hypothetical protein
MEGQSADRWLIERDEFGRLRVRHRHPSGTVHAYVTKDADGVWSASCPSCGERFRIIDPEDRPASRF